MASSRRRLRGISLLSGTVLLAGSVLGSVAAGAASTHPKVVLEFWNAYNQTDTEASTMAKIVIPRFEKLHPGIEVKSVYIPYGNLLSKTLAAISAGSPPDILRSDIIWVPELAKLGALVPLSKSMPGFKRLASEVFPGPLSTNRWGHTYYGLPLDTNTQVLFWNKADFAAAHLSGPPKTVEQIFADAKKLTDPAHKQWGLDLEGTDMWNIDPWVWSMGGSVTNRSYTKAVGYMNGKATVAALTRLVDLYKQGIVSPNILGGAGTIGGEQAFPKGQYAMYIDGPWGAQTYKQQFPHLKYGLEPLPHSVVGGEDAVIPAGGKHIKDAELFLTFLESPFSQYEMALAGQMSVLKNLKSELSLHHYYPPFVAQLKTAEARIPVPQYTQIDTLFSNDLQEALRGKMSVQAAMDQAAQASQALLDQNR